MHVLIPNEVRLWFGRLVLADRSTSPGSQAMQAARKTKAIVVIFIPHPVVLPFDQMLRKAKTDENSMAKSSSAFRVDMLPSSNNSNPRRKTESPYHGARRGPTSPESQALVPNHGHVREPRAETSNQWKNPVDRRHAYGQIIH